MTDSSRLGPWVRRFLLEHLINERNLSRGTQRSYRDTFTVLIPFVARKIHRSVDELDVIHVSADLVRMFLLDLEESRNSAISTRNQRLAAIHSLARFVALHSPEHLAWCGEICAIPFKKCTKTPATYLEKAEIDALLAAPNLQSAQGRRDHLLLLFLYNTGARADEAAQVLIGDLNLAHVPTRDLSWVKIRGKECHSYCIFLRPRHETTGKHTGQQACDLAFSLAAVLRVVRRGIGLGPYKDAHGASRVEPMSEPYPA
jgi:integrase/recombinase XerD